MSDTATAEAAAAAALAAAAVKTPVANTETHIDTPNPNESELVKSLRAENAAHRIKARDAAEAAKASELLAAKATEEKAAAAAAAAADATKQITDFTEKANQRIIRAELKAEAVKLGIVDIDALKLADTSKLTLDDNGEVVGATELIAALKVSKPYLFKEPVESTSQTVKTPKKDDPKPFNALTATKEERAAKARELGIKTNMQ